MVNMHTQQMMVSARQILTSPLALIAATAGGFSWANHHVKHKSFMVSKSKIPKQGWLGRLSTLFTLNKILKSLNLSPFGNN
jgi:hypothetical protein